LKVTGIIIGLGEVGKPLLEILQSRYEEGDIVGRDIEDTIPEVTKCEFLHIAFPQTTQFIKNVVSYIENYKPKYVIIHSTVTPGVTRRIHYRCWTNGTQVYYSPVRANTRDGMKWGLFVYTKFIAGCHGSVSLTVLTHLNTAGIHAKAVTNVETLEYAKLFNLMYYGTCIAVFQEIERIVESHDLHYDTIKDFIRSTEIDSGGKVPRPLYYGGFIGGHCVIPAFEKLLSLHDVPLLKDVIESNIKREGELLFEGKGK